MIGTRIYISTIDLDVEPHTLASEVFDSIYICATNRDSVIIKFTHENVTGYSENIFSEHSTWATWDFEIREWNKYNGIKKLQKDYQYIFMILKKEMTNN